MGFKRFGTRRQLLFDLYLSDQVRHTDTVFGLYRLVSLLSAGPTGEVSRYSFSLRGRQGGLSAKDPGGGYIMNVLNQSQASVARVIR